MIRIVLDTNILIFALLSPQGPPAQVLLMTIIDPDTQLCVSGDIFAEYEEVIRRPRFNRSDSEIVATLRTIREKGFLTVRDRRDGEGQTKITSSFGSSFPFYYGVHYTFHLALQCLCRLRLGSVSVLVPVFPQSS
jgi:putative PIN family toxin of toxin-antitoxin system